MTGVWPPPPRDLALAVLLKRALPRIGAAKVAGWSDRDLETYPPRQLPRGSRLYPAQEHYVQLLLYTRRPERGVPKPEPSPPQIPIPSSLVSGTRGSSQAEIDAYQRRWRPGSGDVLAALEVIREIEAEVGPALARKAAAVDEALAALEAGTLPATYLNEADGALVPVPASWWRLPVAADHFETGKVNPEAPGERVKTYTWPHKGAWLFLDRQCLDAWLVRPEATTTLAARRRQPWWPYDDEGKRDWLASARAWDIAVERAGSHQDSLVFRALSEMWEEARREPFTPGAIKTTVSTLRKAGVLPKA